MHERCESISEQGSEWLITFCGDFTFYSSCGDSRKRVKTRASDEQEREQEAYENAFSYARSKQKGDQEAFGNASKKL